MKLLKIGSSPSCDIVLNSEFVSSHHADITVLDNGEIVIEDKNSTNGTYVGTKKINPNQEVQVKRGDYIRFADTDLVWARIPSPENNAKYKTIVNIGSNFRNDIVLNSGTVSRYHATVKIEKGGKAFITDNASKNGTQVNGIRISAPTRIKRGDNVLIGGEDITEQLKQYLPSSVPVWGIAAGAVAAIAAVALLVWVILKIISGGGTPEQVRPTVAYVYAAYHYNVTLEDNPFKDEDNRKLLEKETPAAPYTATAFFLDEKGRMATNRHVAMPWAEEYREDGVTQDLQRSYQEYLLSELQVSDWQFFFLSGAVDAIQKLQTTALGQAILDESKNLAGAQAMIRMIQNSKIVIDGAIDYISIGYSGKNYTHVDGFERCYVLEESGNKDIDLAILQLNNKTTPTELISGKTDNGQKITMLNADCIVEDPIIPLKEDYNVIGYPAGSYDPFNHSLEPRMNKTQCTKIPSKYTFEFGAISSGGSSGSPLFDNNGKIVGVLCSGIANQPVTFAVHAKYLKELYHKAIDK